MNTVSNILVTGCAGFIGYHTTKTLLKQGHNVFGIDSMNDYYDTSLKLYRVLDLSKNKNFYFRGINITNLPSVLSIMDTSKVTSVIHLAAQAGVRYSVEHPEEYVSNNILGTMNIFEGMKENNISKIVYASSSSVYGNSGDDNHPISVYAMSKRSNELTAHVYKDMYGVDSLGLRFFTVYGPFGRPDMAYMSFTKKILSGETIELYNNGYVSRDFTYVDDIVTGIIKAHDYVMCHDVCDSVDLGKGEPNTVFELVHGLETYLGKKANTVFVDKQRGDVEFTKANITKAKELFDYTPTTPLDVGLKNFCDWYKEYYK